MSNLSTHATHPFDVRPDFDAGRVSLVMPWQHVAAPPRELAYFRIRKYRGPLPAIRIHPSWEGLDGLDDAGRREAYAAAEAEAWRARREVLAARQ